MGLKTLNTEKCWWLGGQHTWTFFCSPRLQLRHQQTVMTSEHTYKIYKSFIVSLL